MLPCTTTISMSLVELQQKQYLRQSLEASAMETPPVNLGMSEPRLPNLPRIQSILQFALNIIEDDLDGSIDYDSCIDSNALMPSQ